MWTIAAQEGTSPASAMASTPRAVGTRVEPRLITAEVTTAIRTTGLETTGEASAAEQAVPPTVKNTMRAIMVETATR